MFLPNGDRNNRYSLLIIYSKNYFQYDNKFHFHKLKIQLNITKIQVYNSKEKL